MEIIIDYYRCGDTLEIVAEYTCRGNLIISVEPCKFCLETSETNKKNMGEY